MFNAGSLEKKWEAVLEHKDCQPITDKYKKATVARLLENQEIALREERAMLRGFLTEDSTTTSAVQNFDPVLISLVRRAMPNIIAYDIAGVQPMTQPTGLIFAMQALHKTITNKAVSGGAADESEALYYGRQPGDAAPSLTKPDTAFSGDPYGAGLSTTAAESLSGERTARSQYNKFGEMGFKIEKTSVTALSRALRATYTMELAQDLRAVHGLDAETELANILSTEILAEINMEIVDGIKAAAKNGGYQAGGTFDLSTNADGRWSVEKYKGLIYQIERDANAIALDTRRGKGNFIVVSSNVASAIAAAGMLDYTPALDANLAVDPTGNLLAGTLNGKIKVFVDPYTTVESILVGYRGTNPYDAGVFYCPYVPLTMMRAIGQDDFQPRIGFKTRYGIRANPFVKSTDGANDRFGTAGDNFYFRYFTVSNLIGDFNDPYPYTG